MADLTTKIENLQDLIKDSIDGEVMEQKVESLLPPGENFGSIVYKVDFKVKKEGNEEEYHAVAKCMPLNAVTKELFNIQETFKAEIGWYTVIIPTLKQFQKNYVVKKEIDFFQPFYGARISLDSNSDKVDSEGVILTQNLKYLGYQNIDRHSGFDLITTYTILKDLATFHAVPLALRIQNPELFDKNIKPYLASVDEFEKAMKEGYNKSIFAVFDHIPECQQYIDKIRKYVDEAYKFGSRPLREPWLTVTHMDFWTNNIMITGGKDSKTIILDFQFTSLGTPASDLMFFLLTSVNLDVVKDKLDDFIKFYYDEFTRNLQELKVPLKNYSFEGLLKEIDTEMKIGEFGHALFHTIIIMREKGKANMNSSDGNFKKEDIKGDTEINERQVEKFKWIALETIRRNWI